MIHRPLLALATWLLAPLAGLAAPATSGSPAPVASTASLGSGGQRPQRIANLARLYAKGVARVNNQQRMHREEDREEDLGADLKSREREALEELLAMEVDGTVGLALVRAGLASLDILELGTFERVCERLEQRAERAELGHVLLRDRYLLHGLQGIEPAHLEAFAVILDRLFLAYDARFGFEDWSKLQGKRLRFVLRVADPAALGEGKEPGIRFVHNHPWHSEVAVTLDGPEALSDPAASSFPFLYDLAHEMGHLIAFWGDRKNELDHHAWAHYAGLVALEQLREDPGTPELEALATVGPRLSDERAASMLYLPSFADRGGVLALLLTLHDRLGPAAIGAAINDMDRNERWVRLNQVRYYDFAELRDALLVPDLAPADAELVRQLLPAEKMVEAQTRKVRHD